MSRSRNLCSYRNCSNSAYKVPGLRMFTFPKYKEQCEEWIRNCGNTSLLGMSPTKLHKNNRICSDHFKKEDVLISGRLRKGSLPFQYSAAESNQTTAQKTQNSPRKYESRLCESSPSVNTSSASFTVDNSPSVNRWIEMASPRAVRLRTVKRDLFESPSKTAMKKKLSAASKKLTEKRKAAFRLRQKIKIGRKASAPANIANMQFKTKDAETLFKMQIHKKGMSWRKAEKQFATTLYLRSPSAYKFLCTRLILPGVSTLQKTLSSKKMFKTGFNTELIMNIKTKAESMTTMEKACVVMFDEMSIKQHLEYSPMYDIVEGYEDMGKFGRTTRLAKQATIFMARGLFYQWKLPLGYFLSENGLSGLQIKSILKDCIQHLTEAGLAVKATVCDQGTTNSKAYNLLGIKPDRPYFSVNENRKIFALFDAPHLLKSLRNNLLTHDLIYNGKTVSFSDVRKLYQIDSSSKTTRAAPKLTPAHIWPNSFQKMSVSLAAQVFSHTTSSALKTAVETGQINSSTGLHTAEFLEQINSLFDALNSRTYKTSNPNRCSLSETNSNIIDIFERSKELFLTLKKINAKYPRPPCFNGFILTINGLLQLLKNEGCKYLLTSRLNQDPLENLFSSIRQRGGWNRNPTIRIIRSSLKTFTYQQLIEPPKSTSYDPDMDTILEISSTENPERKASGSVGLMTDSSSSLTSSQSTSSNAEPEPEPVTVPVPTVTLEECSQVYVAGYLAHKYNMKFKCSRCLDIMCESNSALTSKRELLIFNKTFDNVKLESHHGLKAPSETLIHVVDVGLKIYKKMFAKIAHKDKIVKRFVNISKRVVSLDSLTCSKCSERSSFVLSTLFKLMLFKQCKWINAKFKSSALNKIKMLQHV